MLTTLLETEFVCRAKIAPDGLLWAALCRSNQILIINPQTLNVVSTIGNIKKPTDLAFSPDKSIAYVSSLDNIVFAFDLQRRTLINTITDVPPNNTKVDSRNMSMSVSPDSKILAVGNQNIVSLIDTISLKTITSFTFQNRSFFFLRL